MTPEAYEGRTEKRLGLNGENGSEVETDDVVTVYSELVARIDRWLREPGNEVRQGTQAKAKESLQVIEKALKDYRYFIYCLTANSRFDALALSFNGGKDCLVLLLLYIYVLHQTHSSPRRIPTCFVTPPQTFVEIDNFVTECASRYNLDVKRIALPMKPAFEHYLEYNSHVKAVLVGTRRTDPHGEFLTHYDRTDQGWPSFMRVHPVIDWHYWEIWDVLCFS
jgi:FAD synthetase